MDFGFKLPKIQPVKVKPISLKKVLPNKREIARQTNFTNQRIREPVPAKRRDEVYKRANHKCEWKRCKEKEILDIHHKNMNSSNNNLSNLILLCPTHHRKWHQENKRVVERNLIGIRISEKVVKRNSLKKKKSRTNNSLYGNYKVPDFSKGF